ncbi:hypothetical protein [Marinobacterium sp. MBR-109]|jgi:hypothetical protein|uniref:hypothetical protein n=1 Tax=Marinobacterium sp. MBR-109 TaxID=3156462 RepID=UPI00339A8C72
MELHLNCELASTFSLAAQQNAYPLLKRALVSTPEATDGEPSGSINDIRIRLTSDPVFFEPEEWLIDRLAAGQSAKLQERPLKPLFEKLTGLTEQMQVQLTFAASYIDAEGQSRELISHYEVCVLPADYWGANPARQSCWVLSYNPTSMRLKH